MKEEKNCWNCAYKEELPGDAHIKCVRQPGFKVEIHLTKWSRCFPLNFDPVWIKECEGWSDKREEEKTKKNSAMEDLIGILGSVGRI